MLLKAFNFGGGKRKEEGANSGLEKLYNVKLRSPKIKLHSYIYEEHVYFRGGNPFGVVADVQDCNSVVSEFELQLRSHDSFQTNTFWISITPYSSSYGLKSAITVLLQEWLWH